MEKEKNEKYSLEFSFKVFSSFFSHFGQVPILIFVPFTWEMEKIEQKVINNLGKSFAITFPN